MRKRERERERERVADKRNETGRIKRMEKKGKESIVVSWEFNSILSSSDAIKFYALRQCVDDDVAMESSNQAIGTKKEEKCWPRERKLYCRVLFAHKL